MKRPASQLPFVGWLNAKKHYESMPASNIYKSQIKAKIAAKATGRIFSLETRAKLSAKIYTKETREKMSLKAKGRVFTEQHKARISAALEGRTFSPEHRAKISALIRSPEHCAAISASKLGKKVPAASMAKWTQQNAIQHLAYGISGSPIIPFR